MKPPGRPAGRRLAETEAQEALLQLHKIVQLVHHLAAAAVPLKPAEIVPLEAALTSVHDRLARLLRHRPAAADPAGEAFWRLLRIVATETLAACDATAKPDG